MNERRWTDKLLNACDEMSTRGLTDVIIMLSKWMSDDDVKECLEANEFFEYYSDDDCE